MDSAPDIATTVDAWLRQFAAHAAARSAQTPPSVFREIGAPVDPAITVPALAALAAEALARDRTLWIVTADDAWLPDISNALDISLRPLCLVLPGADYAGGIALRATLALLKSRLTRAAEDSEGPAWAAMRARLRRDDALWRSSLAWSARGLDREAPPAGIGSLFPVRIGPWTLAERLAAPADWVMLIQSGQLPDQVRSLWPGASCTLMLASGPISGFTGLVVMDETIRLSAEIEVLGQELAEMELELATAQGELARFTERYHALIAGRMAELDRIQAELAQARMQHSPDDPVLDRAARQAGARAEQSRRESAAYGSNEPRTEQAFKPSNELKKRFRQLAQKIHPDRADNEADRAWRTQLMSEANRAYRAGDVGGLDEVFALWLEGQAGARQPLSSAVPPAPTFAAAETLAAEAAKIRQRLAAISALLDQLYGSKLYELFAAARVAERQGRDLLQEMAQRLDNQIFLANRELDGFGV
ncbi:MAG: J domain-containing protein [Rhodocyclaceae bacterium]|nr:J domain-containing protein [Rhodocyclaceae bacterium]